MRSAKPPVSPKRGQQRRGGFRLPDAVLHFIGDLGLLQDKPPKLIASEISLAFPTLGAVPSVRTISRVLEAERARRSDTEMWDPLGDELEGVDTAAALPAVAALIERSDGKRSQLTRGEARSITRVVRAAPGIPPRIALVVASMYPSTTPATVLDAFLAYAPWRGDEQWNAYAQAIEHGWLPRWGPPTLRALLGLPPKHEPASTPELDHGAAAAVVPWARLAAMAELESPGSTTPPTPKGRSTRARKGEGNAKKSTR